MSSAVAWISEGNPGPRVGDSTGRQEVTLAGRGRGARLPNPLLSSPSPPPATMTSWQLGLMGMGGPSTLGPGARIPQGSSSLGLTGVPRASAVVLSKRKESKVGCSERSFENQGAWGSPAPSPGLSFLSPAVCPLSHFCTAPLFPALPQFPFFFFLCLGFCHLLLFSRSVVSDSLGPRGLQDAGLPCPSPTPGACSNSCPSNQ